MWFWVYGFKDLGFKVLRVEDLVGLGLQDSYRVLLPLGFLQVGVRLLDLRFKGLPAS